LLRRPPRSTLSSSSAASDVYKRQECLLRKGKPTQQRVARHTPVGDVGRAGRATAANADPPDPVLVADGWGQDLGDESEFQPLFAARAPDRWRARPARLGWPPGARTAARAWPRPRPARQPAAGGDRRPRP